MFKKSAKMGEKLSLALLLLIFLLVVVRPLVPFDSRKDQGEKSPSFPSAPETAPFPLQVYNHGQGEIMDLDLEEYLVGVVAAEMPSSFHPEALRAQAVAARTYTLRKVLDGGGCGHHPGAHICTDHTHCQAWVSREDILQGPQGNLEGIQGAVFSTAGLVLTFQGQLLDAVFHSTCGGHTAAAHHVWSGTAPYLEAVPCGYCHHSPWYRTQREVPLSRLFQAVAGEGAATPVLTDPPIRVLEACTRGRVQTFQVGEGRYSAWQFRRLLDLPSSWLTYSLKGDTLHFALRGYGHGVGMCQYGADGMGQAGRSFEDILNHYYGGAVVEPLSSFLP